MDSSSTVHGEAKNCKLIISAKTKSLIGFESQFSDLGSSQDRATPNSQQSFMLFLCPSTNCRNPKAMVVSSGLPQVTTYLLPKRP